MPTNPFEPPKEDFSEHQEHAKLSAILAATIDRESAGGIRWWPCSEMAPIAVRRWFSFERRNKGKSPGMKAHIRDLAKGLQAHFEAGTPYTAWNEWLHLSDELGRELAEAQLRGEK